MPASETVIGWGGAMEQKWWFKSFGQEFGPVDFADLRKAAESGALIARDVVREGSAGLWQRAEAIQGLFKSEPSDRAEWLVEVVGQTLGPLSITDVAEMIRERKLLPSDRIRQAESAEWQPVGTILDGLKAPQSDSSQTATVPADRDLESFILTVLGTPSERREKLSLAELGLAEDRPALLEQGTALGFDNGIAAIAVEAPPKQSVRWSPMNVFRRGLPPVETHQEQVAAHLELPDETDTSVLLLPPVERYFNAPAAEARLTASGPRRIPWLECLLLLGGIALTLQMFPAAGTRVLAAIDVRGWTWGNWVGMEIVAIVLLGGLAIWRRRY